MGFVASLYKEKTSCNVTLLIDEQEISAHKMVLAYRSEYFGKLLDSQPQEMQLVKLKNFNFEDINDIVTLMYHGEVIIDPDRLPNLHRTAEKLQVFGFVDEKDQPMDEQEVNEKKAKPPPPPIKLGLVPQGDGNFLCLVC